MARGPMRATWRSMLKAAKQEAVLAAQLYNDPAEPRRLEAFYVHLHLAWTYLLHAKFRRDRIDYHGRQPDGRLARVAGEPATWGLPRSVEEEWPAHHPIRRNLELSLALRNHIEHRSTTALDAVAER